MTTPPAAPLHQRTEYERAKRKWSKQEFAARAGIGRVTYDRLATQPTPPIARTVQKLCAALDIDLADGLRLAGLDTQARPTVSAGEPPQFGSPEWGEQVKEAFGKIGEAFGQMHHVLAAQGAMGWAYRGDLDQTRAALAGMQPEQLREVSAAASMLAALADEELTTR